MSLTAAALGRDLLAGALPPAVVGARPDDPDARLDLLREESALLAESLNDRREAFAAMCALLGIRVELGPLRLTAEPGGSSYRVTVEQDVRLVMPDPS